MAADLSGLHKNVLRSPLMITDDKLADFAAALRRQAAGDVRTDALTRALYSSDASLYQLLPLSLIHI